MIERIFADDITGQTGHAAQAIGVKHDTRMISVTNLQLASQISLKTSGNCAHLWVTVRPTPPAPMIRIRLMKLHRITNRKRQRIFSLRTEVCLLVYSFRSAYRRISSINLLKHPEDDWSSSRVQPCRTMPKPEIGAAGPRPTRGFTIRNQARIGNV